MRTRGDDGLIGQTLSHYKVLEKLGEGGMGAVYRAVDTRLGRTVAIKILPAGRMASAEKKKRFTQEARAASSLNHPNIITIYDIGTADELTYIAMEYVAGRTLHECVRGKGLPLAEVLKYAVQIADALAAAHAAGITHRDLKPANLMVTDKGRIKVLDFGLAKLTERTPIEDMTATLDAPRTAEGAVVGTAAYMSPEQAEGKPVDHRSDIFSFGTILYEMTTGKRPFRGETQMSTLAAILNKEPNLVSEAAEGVPAELERIIFRCLRKEPERRFQHMEDLKVALEEVWDESVSGRPIPGGTSSQAPKTKRLRRLDWKRVAAVLALLAAAGVAVWRWPWRERGPVREPVLVRLTADSGLSTDPALSPDGKLLAYASDRGGEGNLEIWLQQIGGGEPIQLTHDEADDHEPAFSPSGTQIAFRSERDGGGLYVVPALGGEARLLAPHGRNPRYSPDGQSLIYWVGDRQASATIYVASPSGGSPRELKFRPNLQETRYPIWSRDGKSLLFLAREAADASTGTPRRAYDWWLASLETGAAVETGAFRAFQRQGLVASYALAPADWIGERVVFSARLAEEAVKESFPQLNIAVLNEAAQLWEASIDARGQISGLATRLTFGTGLDIKPSVASSGLTAFASLTENIDIWGLPIDPRQAKVLGSLHRVTEHPLAESYPSVSADGGTLMFWSPRAGNADIWRRDLKTGRETRLTAGAAFETFPLVSADGSRVAYQVMEDEKHRSHFVVDFGPGGRPGLPQKVCEDCGNLSDLSADGQKLIYYDDPARGVTLVDVASRAKLQLLRHSRFYLADPRFSADGRWVAFHALTSAVARQIFVAPVRPGAESPEKDWIPVTDGSAMDRLASWSPGGEVLYFISERDGARCIWARRLQPATKQPVGPVFAVQHFHSARRSLLNLQNVNMSRMAIARDQIFVSLPERTGNIWMTRPKE